MIPNKLVLCGNRCVLKKFLRVGPNRALPARVADNRKQRATRVSGPHVS